MDGSGSLVGRPYLTNGRELAKFRELQPLRGVSQKRARENFMDEKPDNKLDPKAKGKKDPSG